MRVARTIAELRSLRREVILELIMDRPGRPTVGFVPTMGALHAGHASLLKRMAEASDVHVASIFVNPLQFGPAEDLSRYPRPLDADMELCRECGVDLLFIPEAVEVYPPGFGTSVSVPSLSSLLEGAARPGHFEGVATVVAKLLAIVGPEKAWFGEKDYQQLLVVRRMAEDLGLGVEIEACPTVREGDGLALSSRNAYLPPHERAVAPRIYSCLLEVKERFTAGEKSTQMLIAHGASLLKGWEEDSLLVDYIVIADPRTLAVREEARAGDRVLIAASLAGTRLIDNIEL